MKHPISPDTSGLYEKYGILYVNSFLSDIPFFVVFSGIFPFRNPQKHPLPAQMAMSSISAGFSYKNVSG